MKRDGIAVGNRRGVAMLLVMIGLVVCTLLTAGFLSTQGTSIAIARNERDAEACRLLAQAGIDMCYAQIRKLDIQRDTGDKPGWREKMSPGTWLNGFAIGNGTVTVKAAAGDGTNSFTNDPKQPVIFTSTATCNGRSFTLTGTIGPTGGGEVFRGGNFFQGTVVVGTGGLPLLAPIALVDSYNSLLTGPYSAGGAKAILWTNSAQGGSVTVRTDSVVNGSIVAGPNSILGLVVNLLGALLGGGGGSGTIAASPETRDPGVVIPPNMTGQADQGSFTSSTAAPALGVWDNINFTLHAGTTINLNNGTYQVGNNLTVASSVHLNVQTNTNTVMYVNGNISMGNNSSITVAGTGTLTIYVGGTVTLSNAQINAGTSNPSTSAVQILGLPSSNSIQMTNGAKLYGVIYAPQASVTMQTGTPQIYGAVIAHDVSVLNTAQIHYDEATKSVKISGISGGTAPPGAADYTYHTAGTY